MIPITATSTMSPMSKPRASGDDPAVQARALTQIL